MVLYPPPLRPGKDAGEIPPRRGAIEAPVKWLKRILARLFRTRDRGRSDEAIAPEPPDRRPSGRPDGGDGTERGTVVRPKDRRGQPGGSMAPAHRGLPAVKVTSGALLSGLASPRGEPPSPPTASEDPKPARAKPPAPDRSTDPDAACSAAGPVEPRAQTPPHADEHRPEEPAVPPPPAGDGGATTPATPPAARGSSEVGSSLDAISGSRAEWKVLEPEVREEPVEHEVFGAEDGPGGWGVLYASVRGKLHAHRGLWRDDALAFAWVDDWSLVALSDGAGSASLARVGARIACNESIQALGELLRGFRLLAIAEGDAGPGEADLYRLRSFLETAALRAKGAVLREAQRRQCSPSDLNATLLLALHIPLGDTGLVATLQVGDGTVGVLTKDGTCTVVGRADHGEYSSETRFLTTHHIEYQFAQRVVFALKKDIRCVAVMCDGVSDDFFPENERLGELFSGHPIRDLKTAEGGPLAGVLHDIVPRPAGGASLRDWLRYELKGSSDDRTLILLYRRDPA